MEYNYQWNEVRLIEVLQERIIKETEQVEKRKNI